MQGQQAIFISPATATRAANAYCEKHRAELLSINPVKRRGELLGYSVSVRKGYGADDITEEEVETLCT